MTKLAQKYLQLACASLITLTVTCTSARAQSEPAKNSSGIEILKLKWERQARLPRNFDPSVIPDNGVFSNMQARTLPPGSTQAPYSDEARRDAAARSAALAPVDYFPNTPARMPVSYVYSITIRNVGSKTIEAVAWDYLFLDPKTRAILGKHQLFTYAKSSSGKTVTLNARQRARPATVVTAENAERAKDKKSRMLEQGVIECVLYADGSTWKNPVGQPGSCELLKQYRLRNQAQRSTAP